MKRAFILLMDSFGIGALPDAQKFGDVGANTLLHIAEDCAAGKADLAGVRSGALLLPNLAQLGLAQAFYECNNIHLPHDLGFAAEHEQLLGWYGFAQEKSLGKDTPSGHWEITGVPVTFEWGYFPATIPCFPTELTAGLIREAKLPGILGNMHSSGTEIIQRLGDEHIKTGKPICYTAADSVFQIAAHEEHFGLERLYEVCKIAYQLVKPYNIGRVIARPFTGTSGNYERTEHRRDYAVPPPGATLLDKLVAANKRTVAIGKIADIFAHRGISKHIDAHGNEELFAASLEQLKNAPDNTLVFTNFVDFDMKYGHRRNVAKYADALEKFDHTLPEFMAAMQPDDVLVITSDHGCDPTFKGTDHTREYIPVLWYSPSIKAGRSLGCRTTFADIGQSLAKYFGIQPLANGTSFY